MSSVVLAASLCVGSAPAYANTNEQLLQRLEQTAKEYRQATEEVERVEAEIAENEQKTEEIEARLPEQRERTAASIKNLYIFQQSSPGLLELVLSATDFNDFISTIRYIDSIHQRNVEEVQALVNMENDLAETQARLSIERDDAVAKQEAALTALDAARSVRQEVQAQADTVAASEATRRAEALAIVQETIDKGISKTADGGTTSDDKKDKEASDDGEEKKATITTRSGNTTEVELAPEPSADTSPIAENTSASEVESWGDRINAYLAGSPLEGYGDVFAEAASEYGVDPRISPAISCIESGKGSVCFQDHNAWGWGSSGWSDWETAIKEHVAGYASIYGSTVTLEGAEMYASNDIYAEWYSLVLSEMDSI